MRDSRVEFGWSKERDKEGMDSLEEQRSGEREEKNGLKEKREEESGGKERRVLAAERREVIYGFGSLRWRTGFRSIRRTTRWVLL